MAHSDEEPGKRAAEFPRRRGNSILTESQIGETTSGSIAHGTSFSTVLAMIATLPLTDQEKAEAVRRLLAE